MGKCNYGCFRASGRKKIVTKESSGDKDSPICHVRVYSEKIKSRGFYIDSFLLKLCSTHNSTAEGFFLSLKQFGGHLWSHLIVRILTLFTL